MTRRTYDRALRALQDRVVVLGSVVQCAIVDSVAALKARDLSAARAIIAADAAVNQKRFAIESEALALIATQQPMAADLRTLAAVLEIATELERVGDYAKGIAKISLLIGEARLIKPIIDLPRMAEKAADMLRRSLIAFINRDVELARSIPLEDDEVDALYNQVYRELLTMIMANPSVTDQATYLLWAAHNLERAADRVTNICERIVFAATGIMAEMDVDDPGPS